MSIAIKASREDVLKKLRENRERHQKIVAESRKGYVEKARAALSKRLDDLASGKCKAAGGRLANIAAEVGRPYAIAWSDVYKWARQVQTAGYDTGASIPDDAVRVFDTRADAEQQQRAAVGRKKARAARDREKSSMTSWKTWRRRPSKGESTSLSEAGPIYGSY